MIVVDCETAAIDGWVRVWGKCDHRGPPAVAINYDPGLELENSSCDNKALEFRNGFLVTLS